jgi:ATP/maltotriose-dependent transcriptional regulator MalT
VDLLDGVLRAEVPEESFRITEEVWLTHPLEESTAEAAATAIAAFLYADRVSTAEALCDRFFDEMGEDQTPHLAAVFLGLQAQIALRRGDLIGTVSAVQRAFALVPPQHWGVGVGVPLGCLLQAAALMGDTETAAKALAHPVPDALTLTRFGLHYKYARGVYYLRTDRPHAALSEFLTCGILMTQWDVDVSALVPWWQDAARAYLALGKPDAALALIEEQEHAQDATGRIRARVLRVRAALESPQQRVVLLQEAVRQSTASGDQVELVGALVDQAHALGAIGEVDAARESARLSREIGGRCGIDVPGQQPTADRELIEPSLADAGLASLDSLTDAEWRVAVLVSRGYTNRQVARALYITVSTVEQHLTRVYRKLNIARRRDLPRWLAEAWRPPEHSRPEGTTPSQSFYHSVPTHLHRLVLPGDAC